jgi:hypothetical protein
MPLTMGLGSTFYIVSKLSTDFHLPPGSFVIDIFGAEQKPGTPLQLWTQDKPKANNQLWKINGGGACPPNYYYIQSLLNDTNGNPLAIDISQKYWTQPDGPGVPGSGTPLDAWTRKPLQAPVENNNNQLWCFYPGGGNYYYINSLMSPVNEVGDSLVIDVTNGGLSGTALQVYNQKSAADATNQLWMFIDEFGGILTPPPPPHSQGT